MSTLLSNNSMKISYTVRDAIFDFFKEIGTDTIFGNPGSTELPMFRNFPSHFRYILGLQEAIVVGIADGYAQATNTAAFVNLHSAAGVGNAMGNIFTAYKNHTPIVITAGQQARSILPFDPFLASVRPTELPQPYVKWAIEPARAQDVPLAIMRAWHIAMQEPRGPVLVSIPVDDWDAETQKPDKHIISHQQRPSGAAISQLVSQLDKAKRPSFIVGSGVDRANASELLVTLAEKNEAEIYVAPMTGRCSFPETHRLFRGFLPASREKIVTILNNHDLIVVFGASAFSYHVEGFGPHIPKGSQLYQIIEDPMVASWTPQGHGIIGNIYLAIEDILAISAPRKRQKQLARQSPEKIMPSSPMTTPYVLQTLHSLRKNNWMIVEEAPSARSKIQKYFPIEKAGGFLTMESGGLGYAMPAAIGTALGMKNKKIIGLVGDGSALYSIQSLWTAAILQLPITWIIFRNGCYAALQDFAPEFGFSSQEYVEGTDLPNIDYVGIARSFGCQAELVSEPENLSLILEKTLNSKTPNLIEIIVKD